MRRLPRVFVLLLLLAFTAALFAKTCPKCDTENSDAAKFCKSCGAKLPEAAPQRPQSPRVQGNAAVSGALVNITSNPSGSRVVVDGQSRGTTPLELRDLGLGRHEYELTRPGYRTFYGEFSITGLYGTMVVTSDPVGAEVLLDAEPKGIAGEAGLALSRVPYGQRTVTARMVGYNDVVKIVEMSTPGPIAVSFKFGSGKGLLSVQSEPSGARLFIDGELVGETPCSAQLAPTRYPLTMSKRGFYDWAGFAVVQYAETVNIRATLDPMPTRKWPLLAAGIASAGLGGFSAVMGESQYKEYQQAGTREEAKRYKSSTEGWDMTRNIAAGAAVVFSGLFFTLKW